MLRAIVSDFARLPGCRVITTLDEKCPGLEVVGVEEHRVSSPQEEQEVFFKLVSASDACLAIAPELGDALTERCRVVEGIDGVQLLNPTAEVTRLCSDKLALARKLEHAHIPTISTSELGDLLQGEILTGPVVVKPRFGAGSQGVRLFESIDLAIEADLDGPTSDVEDWIQQPFVRGLAISAGVLFQPDDERFEVLPIATQRLSGDGTFAYQGGAVPLETGEAARVRDLVESACRQLTGLRGYIGFDLIVPEARADNPVIVEINPRLTTSYLGYRQLTEENLAARMLDDASWGQPISWASHRVEFTPAGDVQITDARVACTPLHRVTS